MDKNEVKVKIKQWTIGGVLDIALELFILGLLVFWLATSGGPGKFSSYLYENGLKGAVESVWYGNKGVRE